MNSESSNAKSDAETHESHETSPEKIHEPISNDPVDEVVPVLVLTSDKVAETAAAAEENAVPEIVEIVPTSSVVATENTVPETILTLLESFNPDKKEEEVDPLQVEASEVRVSRNEPDPSFQESVKEESLVETDAVGG